MRHHQCDLPKDKLLAIARGMDFSQPQGYHAGQPRNNQTPGTSRPCLNMTPEEYQHHVRSGLCFYCYQSGHLYKDCTSCPNGAQGATISAINNASQSYPIIDTTLCYNDHEVNTVALLDSGATLNYMEYSLAEKLGVPIQVNYWLVTLGNKTTDLYHKCEEFVSLKLNKRLLPTRFHVMEKLPKPVVIGFEWWVDHQLNLNYKNHQVTFTHESQTLEVPCLNPQQTPELNNFTMESCKAEIPKCLKPWKSILSKEEATALPKHSQFDHAIDHLPRT